MIYFTADTHFGHERVLNYCNRPFGSVEEMDETIIANWNARAGKKDVIYIIGDFSFADPELYLNRLNGRKILVAGGHDFRWKSRFDKFEEVVDYKYLKLLHRHQAILCHYCFRVWHASHYNSWHLFGHSHGTLEPIGKSWDVGVDNNCFSLLSEHDILEIMNKRPDNSDVVKGAV